MKMGIPLFFQIFFVILIKIGYFVKHVWAGNAERLRAKKKGRVFVSTFGKPKKKKRRISGALAFLLAFILFLVVFGGLCLWAVTNVMRDKKLKGATPSSVSNVSTVEYRAEDARNLLIITTEEQQAQGFVIVRTDPANVRIRTLALPRETNMAVGTEWFRLYELYSTKGVSETRAAIEDQLHISLDNQVVVSYSNIEKILRHYDSGLVFTVIENLDSLKMSGGLKNLTPEQVTDLFRYSEWRGGYQQRADIQAQIVAAMINQYMVPGRLASAEADFNALINLVQSDIKVSHYVQAKPGLDYLAQRNTGDICATVSVAGSYVGSGEQTRFELAETAAEELRTVFGTS